MTPDELRTTILVLDDVAYLNTDAHGLSLRSTVEHTTESPEYHEYKSPGDDGPHSTTLDVYKTIREDVAAFTGVETKEVALTQSTTNGINRITTTLDWEPGGVIVRTDLECPADIFPWWRPEHEGVEVRVVESEAGQLGMDQYVEAVSDAGPIYFSPLTWNYGTRLSVRELTDIARDIGALSVVGAVQSFSQYPVAVGDRRADIVVGVGHKWLLGLWGAGFLYAHHEVVEGIEPHVIGYRGVTEPNADRLDFTPEARRSEVGTTDPAPYVALWEAIDITERVGFDRTEEHMCDLTGRFIETIPEGRLSNPHDPESRLVSFKVLDSEGTVEWLKSAGVVVWTPFEPTAVRVSFHNFNDESDVVALRDGLGGEW